VLLAAIVTYVNRVPQLLANYATTMPLKTYYATLSISMIFLIALYFALAYLALGLSWFFTGRTFGPDRIPSWSEMKSEYYRDAVIIGTFGATALAGLTRVPGLFTRWPLLRHSLGAAVPGSLDALNPAAGAIASGISSGLIALGLIGVIVGLIAAYVRPVWMRAALVVLVAVLITTDVATPGAFLRDALFHLVVVAAVWLFVTRIVRFNVMGYFLLAAMISVVPVAVELLQQPNEYFRMNGYAAVAFVLLLASWPLRSWIRPKWRTL
jgi:hypothetical protein